MCLFVWKSYWPHSGEYLPNKISELRRSILLLLQFYRNFRGMCTYIYIYKDMLFSKTLKLRNRVKSSRRFRKFRILISDIYLLISVLKNSERNMETEAYRTPIQRFYAEQSIFITGIYSPQVFYFTGNLLISLYIYL